MSGIFDSIRAVCRGWCGSRDTPSTLCDCGMVAFNQGIDEAERQLAVTARHLAREIESLAVSAGYQRPAESHVCAFLDAAEMVIAGGVERCDGCGVARGKHPEYMGEACYMRRVDLHDEPDRCGNWIGGASR